MLGTRLLTSLFCVGVTLVSAAAAQNFPSKPIRIVVNGEPGGGGDFTARLISPGLAANLGQPMIVDNRPSGVIPGEIVAKAPPDGYTLLVSTGVHWLMPFMRDAMPYDPVRDFSPVALVTQAPNILVVHPPVAANSVKELVALAKARPGSLNYSSAATGSSSQIAAELFKSLAGVNIVRIPYKGNGPGLLAVIGGEVQMMFATAGSVTTHIKSGSLRALAITSARPSMLFTGLPTVSAAGLPGYESGTITGLWAPAKTASTIVSRLNGEIARVLERKEVKDRFLAAGSEIVAGSPEQFAAAIRSDSARMGKVIRDAGIRE